MLDLHLLDRPPGLGDDDLPGFFDCRGEWHWLEDEVEPC
jgi:hypothetical protein